MDNKDFISKKKAIIIFSILLGLLVFVSGMFIGSRFDSKSNESVSAGVAELMDATEISEATEVAVAEPIAEAPATIEPTATKPVESAAPSPESAINQELVFSEGVAWVENDQNLWQAIDESGKVLFVLNEGEIPISNFSHGEAEIEWFGKNSGSTIYINGDRGAPWARAESAPAIEHPAAPAELASTTPATPADPVPPAEPAPTIPPPAEPAIPAAPAEIPAIELYYYNTTLAVADGFSTYNRLHIDNNNTLYWYGGSGLRTTKKDLEVNNVRSVHAKMSQHSTDGFTYFYITANNELWAWGDNEDGMVGDDTGLYQGKPVLIMNDVANISSKNGVVYAYKTDNSRWSWGDGVYAPEKIDDYYDPNPELRAEHVTMKNYNNTSDNESITIFSGDTVRNYEITSEGVLMGWGDNDGKLGDGARATRESPVKIFDNVKGLNETYFITESNDWYEYSSSSSDLNPNYPKLVFTNVLYINEIVRNNAYNNGSWFTPDGKLMSSSPGNSGFLSSPFEVREVISDIKLPSIIKG